MLITTLQLLFLRFGIHGMSEMEANMNSVMLEAKTRAVAQSGQAAASIFDLFLTAPEFRAGFFLAGLAMVTAVLIVLSTAGGAFAGFIRSRQTKAVL
jgi:cellobiose-specific phosphotransferase system component IIC